MLRKAFALLLIAGLGPVLAGTPAQAQGRSLSLISDAEVEHDIATFARPIFLAAGLVPDSVHIYLVNDQDLNAFVGGGQNLFINTGLLMQTDDVGQLLGVIAHETGHLAGGHVARGEAEIERAQSRALLTSLLALAAGAATGNPGAGMAVLSGGQSLSQEGFLTFTRSMEASADQAALTYLDRAGLSAAGMLSFLERLADQELAPTSRAAAYLSTHPLTADRVETVAQHVAASPQSGQPMPAGFDDMFSRMQAKLTGFLDPVTALRRYPAGDAGVPARYARAIANFRRGDLGVALSTMDGLIAQEPNNPYFHELRGQILLETGRVAEARPSYERALALLPGTPDFLVPLAQAKLEGGNPADVPGAIDDLNQALAKGGRGRSFAWHLLATAYGRNGDMGMAAVALAEEALARGDRDTARQQATEAQRLLPTGSRGWVRAQDILLAAADR